MFGPRSLRQKSLLEKRKNEFTTDRRCDVTIFARHDVIFYTNELTKSKLPNEKNRYWKDFLFQTTFTDWP